MTNMKTMDEWTVKVCNSYCYDCGRFYDAENFETHHKRLKLGDDEDSGVNSHEEVDEIETSKPNNSDSITEEQQETTEVELVHEINDAATNDISTTPSNQSQRQDEEKQTEDLNEKKEKNPGVFITIQCSHKESASHMIYIRPKILEEGSRNTSVQPMKYNLSTSKEPQFKSVSPPSSSCSASSNIQVQSTNTEDNTTTIGVGNSTTSTCTSSPVLNSINVSRLKSYLHCSKCYETFSEISVLIEHFDKCDVERDLSLMEWRELQYSRNFKDTFTLTPTTPKKDASTLTPATSKKNASTFTSAVPKKDTSVLTDPIKVGVVYNGSIPVLKFGEKEIPLPFLTPPAKRTTSTTTRPYLVDQYQQTEEQESLPPLEFLNDFTNDSNDVPLSPLNSNSQDEHTSFDEFFPLSPEPYVVTRDDGKFKCSKCAKLFTTRYNCKYHLEVHLNTLKYQCPICKYKCYFRTTLWTHLDKKHKNQKEYKCFSLTDTSCDLTFPSVKELAVHMKSHRKIKKIPPKVESLPCSKCGKKISSSMIKLEEHEKTCTYEYVDEGGQVLPPPPPPSTHPCTHQGCSRIFLQRTGLLGHLSSHKVNPSRGQMEKYAVQVDGKKLYKCPRIDLGCSTVVACCRSLKGHLAHHDPNRKKFACTVPECGREFLLASTLRKHTRKVHQGIREDYLCSVCGACLHCPNAFKTHLKVHTGEKPFACLEIGCGKKFHLNSLLKSHRLTHSRAYQKLCKFCGKAFRSNCKVRLHELTHTQNHPFKCKFCDSSFRNIVALKRHVCDTHSEDIEFDIQNPKTFRR